MQNEQIPTSRLATGTSNTLGISDGHVGLGIQIDGPQSVNGYIQNNDQVVVYATFPQGETVTKQDLKHLLAPAQLQRFLTALQTGTHGQRASHHDAVRLHASADQVGARPGDQ